MEARNDKPKQCLSKDNRAFGNLEGHNESGLPIGFVYRDGGACHVILSCTHGQEASKGFSEGVEPRTYCLTHHGHCVTHSSVYKATLLYLAHRRVTFSTNVGSL